MVSCSNQGTENGYWWISRKSLYKKCSNLNGLGNLIIDETTYQQLLETAEIWSLGYYGFGEYWAVENHELHRFLRDKCKNIRRVTLKLSDQPNIVDNLGIGSVECVFLRDTLVGISLDDEGYRAAKNMIIEKYGNGRGYYKSFESLEKAFDWERPIYETVMNEHEERIWENEKVLFERHYHKGKILRFLKGTPNPRIIQKECIITSKKRYEEFLSILNEAKETYEKNSNNK